MSEWEGYKCLEFSGAMLIPGFSIYLLEIERKGKRFFYLGMTGDSFFPSARAAFHRLSGHLELADNSKQNQLWVALKTEVGIKKEADLATLNIKMHHFPIKGFEKWVYGSLHHENVKANINSKEYKKYKKLQQEVLSLEAALIMPLRGNC